MRFELRAAVASWLVALPLMAALPVMANPGDAVAPPRVDTAWIRWLPGAIPAAGYLTLTNPQSRPAVLLSASSPAFGDISLHRTVSRGGSMEMLAVDHIEVPGHSTLTFETTGYHLMLAQPGKSVHPGVHVTVTLRFADSPPLPVDFEVRNPDGSAAAPSGSAKGG